MAQVLLPSHQGPDISNLVTEPNELSAGQKNWQPGCGSWELTLTRASK